MNNLATEYNITGEHSLAVEFCLGAVELWTRAGNKHALANGWDTLGSSYHGSGDFDQAAVYYELAIGTFREPGRTLTTCLFSISRGGRVVCACAQLQQPAARCRCEAARDASHDVRLSTWTIERDAAVASPR